MSELITARSTHVAIRWQLLATVSALTLCGAAFASPSDAQDSHPTVWVELGGNLERVDGKQDAFLPPFLVAEPRPAFETEPPASTQRPPRYALGGDVKVIFAPDDTDWQFSAAIRFGRSNNGRHQHQQTTQHVHSGTNFAGTAPFYANLTAFGDTDTAHAERHAVADFMVGKDVGLGMWGRGSSSVFSFGVRFAQFTARSSNTLREAPDPFESRIPKASPFFPSKHKYTTNTHHHSFYAQDSIWRSFSGIGPSLSLTGSQPFMGNMDTMEVAFDWGANAAVLFGRQKVRGNHKTTGYYFTNHVTVFGFPPKTVTTNGAPVGRSRTVVVPNVGGFAGLSLHRANAKVSFGYRADFFFGAMDGGIDARNAATVGFHGPFAKISIGLGG